MTDGGDPVTESEAIEQIQAHINSGKLFMAGLSRTIELQLTLPWLLWADKRNIWITVHQPITLVRLLSEDEVRANLYETSPWESRHNVYYEVVLD